MVGAAALRAAVPMSFVGAQEVAAQRDLPESTLVRTKRLSNEGARPLPSIVPDDAGRRRKSTRQALQRDQVCLLSLLVE
jgi:hypothetical protein